MLTFSRSITVSLKMFSQENLTSLNEANQSCFFLEKQNEHMYFL